MHVFYDYIILLWVAMGIFNDHKFDFCMKS